MEVNSHASSKTRHIMVLICLTIVEEGLGNGGRIDVCLEERKACLALRNERPLGLLNIVVVDVHR